MKHIVSTLPQTTHNHIKLFIRQRQCHLHALSVRVWKTASSVNVLDDLCVWRHL